MSQLNMTKLFSLNILSFLWQIFSMQIMFDPQKFLARYVFLLLAPPILLAVFLLGNERLRRFYTRIPFQVGILFFGLNSFFKSVLTKSKTMG